MYGGSEYGPPVPEFSVRVNGNDLPADAEGDLISVSMYEDLEAPNMFTLQLSNWDMDRLTVKWSDDELWQEGGEVEVLMGYQGNLEALMVGEITGLEPAFSANESPTLIVRGHDRLHRLLRGRHTRTFTNMKDSDIAGEIARDLGLTLEAEDTGNQLEYVLQHNQTDMEFLQERAHRIGYEVAVADKALLFRARQNTGTEVFTLSREEGLLEFYPRLTTMSQVSRFAVRGWDPLNKEELVGEANLGDESTAMDGVSSGPAAVEDAFGESSAVRVNWPVSTQAEAAQIALGRYNDMALAYISGDGLCEGRTDLRAGTVIRIEGMGEKFSGAYYVTSTTHTCSPAQGYQTAFTVRRNAA